MSNEIALPAPREQPTDTEALFAIKSVLGKLSEAAMDMATSEATSEAMALFGEYMHAEVGLLRVAVRRWEHEGRGPRD